MLLLGSADVSVYFTRDKYILWKSTGIHTCAFLLLIIQVLIQIAKMGYTVTKESVKNTTHLQQMVTHL